MVEVVKVDGDGGGDEECTKILNEAAEWLAHEYGSGKT